MGPGLEIKAGTCISVFWDLDRKWYNAEVLDYDPATGKCKVLYTDGEREEFDLTEVKHRILWSGKLRERDKMGDGGSSKTQVDYVVETLLDIEDRLPPRGVFNNKKRWWQAWHSRVTNAGKSGNVLELVRAAVDIAFQMKDNVSSPWWKSERSDWQKQVESARTSNALASRMSDLLTKAVDWAAARQLFSSESSESEEDTTRSEIRQERMGKEKSYRRSDRRVSESGGVKKLTSYPAHLVRRSKRKLIAVDDEELSFPESPRSEAGDMDSIVARDMTFSVKRRKEAKADEGHLLDSNIFAGKKGPSETHTQEDQSSVDVAKVKRYRRKGHSLESREHEEKEDAQQIEMNRKTQIGYSRVKRSKPNLESDVSEAGQASETVYTRLTKKVGSVPAEDVIEAGTSMAVNEVEDIAERKEAAISVSSPVRRSGRQTGIKIASEDVDCSKSSLVEERGQTDGIPGATQSAKDGPQQVQQEPVVQMKRKRGRPKKIKPVETAAGVELGRTHDGDPKDKKDVLPDFTKEYLPSMPAYVSNGVQRRRHLNRAASDTPVKMQPQKTRDVAHQTCFPVKKKVGRPKKIKPANVGGVESDDEKNKRSHARYGTSDEVEKIWSSQGANARKEHHNEVSKRKVGRPKKIKPAAEESVDVRTEKEHGNICAANKKTSDVHEVIEPPQGPLGECRDMIDGSADVMPNRRGRYPRKVSYLLSKEEQGGHYSDSRVVVEAQRSCDPMEQVSEDILGNGPEGDVPVIHDRGEQVEEPQATEPTEGAPMSPGRKGNRENVQLVEEADRERLTNNLNNEKDTDEIEYSREISPSGTGGRRQSLVRETRRKGRAAPICRAERTRIRLSGNKSQEPNKSHGAAASLGDTVQKDVLQMQAAVLDTCLKEDASIQSSVKRCKKVSVEPHVENVHTRSGRRIVGKKITILETQICGSTSEEITSGYSTSEDSSDEYRVEEDGESQEFMDIEDSWGGRLPSDVSDFVDEVPSPIRKSRRGQVEPSRQVESRRGQFSEMQDLISGDEICSICEFAGADELMLLCDESGCTCASHTFCLNPPLKGIPEGEWLCPHCKYEKSNPISSTKRHTKTCSGVHYPRKVISSIIGRRQEPLTEEEKTSGTTKIQYLVKWDSLSHEHDSWIPEDWLLFMDNRMVMNFQRKHLLSSEINNINLDERRPEWLWVDRIIGCRYQGGKLAVHPSHVSALLHSREKEKNRVQFLVKWQGLEHKIATWEEEKDTEEFQKAISDYIKRHESGEEIRSREEDAKPVAAIKLQPDYLRGGVMYGFQLHGLKWLLSNFEQGRSVILADEMGLGKTVQSLAFISCVRYEKLSSKPVLVIAPKSTLPGWEQEFRRWAPSLNVVVYQGDKENRALIRECEFYTASRKPLFEVLVTSYELATFDNSLLSKFHWASLIVDEGHRVKNVRSKLGTLLKRHKADFRLLLTGTPVQNTLTELFALLHFLDPMEFPDPEFSAQQFTEVDAQGGSSQTDAKVIEQQVSRLHELLNPRMLRRLKSEVLSDMIPGKKLVEVSCALTPLQRHLYIAILKKNFKILNKGVQSGMKRSLHTVLTDLKMVCNHPYLFPGKEPHQHDSQEAYKMLVAASGKLQLLEKLLPLLKEGGHRVLLFSQMTKMLDILEDFVSFLGLHYSRIDGSTSASIRQKNIAEFNTANSSTFIFLISTRAGGLGINLPSADTVIIYDPDFNPFVDIQAQARAHRIGQEKTVLVYQLITKCSVEEKILQRSRKKLAMENLVMSRELKETAVDINNLLLHGAQKVLDEHDMEATSIKFTDENVKKLLDRKISTSATNNDEAQAHGYLGAVQGAGFATPTIDEHDTQDSKGSDGTEWQILLQNFVEQDVKEELGRGKRVRKQVLYAVEGHGEGQEDDEYDPTSDGEYSSSSDESLDLEGVNLKQRRKAMNHGQGGVPVVEFPSMQGMSGPISYAAHMAAVRSSVVPGAVLPGASVPVSPLPPRLPLLAPSVMSARGIGPPLMGPSANMVFPVMSPGVPSFGTVDSTIPAWGKMSGGQGSSDANRFFSNLSRGASLPRSIPTNLSVSGDKSGHVSAEAVGVPSSTVLSGAGLSTTHSHISHMPLTGMYPYPNNFGINTNMNPYTVSYAGMPHYTASPFPGMAGPPYFSVPPFSSQPVSSHFSFTHGQVDPVNSNITSNPAREFSNLQHAIQGWKTASDKNKVSTPAVAGVAGSGGGSKASCHHGAVSDHQLPKASSAMVQSIPSPVHCGIIGSHESLSKPVNTKRVSISSHLSTAGAAGPCVAGYCSVPSTSLPCPVEPKITGVSLVPPPVTASAVPDMSGIRSVLTAYPAFECQDATVLQFSPALTNFQSSTNMSMPARVHETVCSSHTDIASAVGNSKPSPVMPDGMISRPSPPTPKFCSPHQDPVKLAPLLDGRGSSCEVSLEASRILSHSTSPSHRTVDPMSAPRRRKTCSRKSNLSTSPTSQTSQCPMPLNNLGVPLSEAGEGTVETIFVGGDLSSSGNQSSTGQSQPALVIFGEGVGNEVGSCCIPEENHDHSSLASSSKPLPQGRKPLWVPKGDAGLLMGHSQEHGGMSSAIVKVEEGSSPDSCTIPLPHIHR